MRKYDFRFLAAAAAITGATSLTATHADAGGPVNVLVLKEHGVGSAAQAQPYVEKFVAMAAKQNGWAAGKSEYHTSRGNADAFISAQKPNYGIMSLAAFLDFRGITDDYADYWQNSVFATLANRRVRLLAGYPHGVLFDADNKGWEVWTYLVRDRKSVV